MPPIWRWFGGRHGTGDDLVRCTLRMKFIGITGGVGAGKSSILQYISAHTLCRIYLADDVAHELELPGEKVYEALDAQGCFDTVKEITAQAIEAIDDLSVQVEH